MEFVYRKVNFFLPLIVLFFFASGSFAQSQKISIQGKILDADSRQPVAFAAISESGTTNGTLSDSNGNYNLSVNANDTIIVSDVGFVTLRFVTTAHQIIYNFFLKKTITALHSVTIYAGKNPADAVMKKVIANKLHNDKQRQKSFECSAYSKTLVDADNFPDSMRDRKLLGPFNLLLDNKDTANGKEVIPVFITESISDVYYRGDPKATKEIIHATKISGINDESASQFLGRAYQDFDLYNNFITIFGIAGVSLISPLADDGLLFYKYYIMDSAKTSDGSLIYQIAFKSRNLSDNTFEGTIWVDTSGYALTNVNIALSPTASISFVKQFAIKQSFENIGNHFWALQRDEMRVNFQLMNNRPGVFADKITLYSNFKRDDSSSLKIFSNKQDIIISDTVDHENESYWKNLRPIPLTAHERRTYATIDSIENSPSYKIYDKVFTTLFTGYYKIGKFKIGPIYDFYSNNEVEGNRVFFGGETSDQFSRKLLLYGYTAYGFTDERFKYNGGFVYQFHRSPFAALYGDYTNDLNLAGNSFSNLGSSNFIASLLRKNVPFKYDRIVSYKLDFQKEWRTGFSMNLGFTNLTQLPLFPYSFTPANEKTGLQTNESFTTSEIEYQIRFAYQEKFFFNSRFVRSSLGSRYPIVSLVYALGIKNLFSGGFDYDKLTLNISDFTHDGIFGETEYLISMNKTFGTLPYLLLNIAPGNDYYYYNNYAFNGMNEFEFATDEYASLYFTQHFGGFIFNKIPGIDKLKWRMLGTFRGLWGNMSEANRSANEGNGFTIPSAGPYMELGAGIENIFRFFRVDCFWRLTYLHNPDVTPFGVRGSLQIGF
jgi:hypothetical protein